MRPTTLLLLLVAAGLAGCGATKTTWIKPGAGESERQGVLAECRSYARTKVDREIRLDETTPADRTIGDDTLPQQMRRYDARKTVQRLFESCMRQRGYRPVAAGDAE